MARKLKGRKSKSRTKRSRKSRSRKSRHNRRYLKKGGRKRTRRTRSRTRSRTRRRRRRRRRQRGGGACPYEKNMGEYFTLRPYNNLSGGDPARNLINSNANNRVPLPYKKSGGGKRRRSRVLQQPVQLQRFLSKQLSYLDIFYEQIQQNTGIFRNERRNE